MNYSSFPVDLEFENFGWSERFISRNSIENSEFESSFRPDLLKIGLFTIIDKTMIYSIFLIIYIYCLVEILFDVIIASLDFKIPFHRVKLFNFSDHLPMPRLTTK